MVGIKQRQPPHLMCLPVKTILLFNPSEQSRGRANPRTNPAAFPVSRSKTKTTGAAPSHSNKPTAAPTPGKDIHSPPASSPSSRSSLHLHCPTTSSSISSFLHSSISPNSLEKKQSNTTMRLSCNGCRVLRKGCTEACTIRPCLQWIKAPDAQANATVFLAKFYGRAGLLNLIDASPSDELRPAVFRSLLYEACGRIVNPVYGSVGLLWSGSWHLCQAAVEAVLKGAPIVQISADEAAAAAPGPGHLHKAAAAACYDIRHVAAKAKPPPPAGAPDAAAPASSAPAADAQSSKAGGGSVLHKVAKPSRTRFKRASTSPSSKRQASSKPSDTEDDEHHVQLMAERASSDDDTHGHHQEASAASLDTDAEAASHVSQAEQATAVEEEGQQQEQQQQPGLDLTLGFGLFAPVAAAARPPTPPADAVCSRGGWSSSVEEGVAGFQFL